MAWDEDQKKCGGLTAFGLFTILVSAAMIVMGVLNLDLEADDPVAGGYCRAEVNIPVFLIGGGVVFILLLLFRFIFQVRRKKGHASYDFTKIIFFSI